MNTTIRLFGDKIRDYVSVDRGKVRLGGMVLRVLFPIYGAAGAFISLVAPDALHDSIRQSEAPGMALVLCLAFGVAEILFLVTPPQYEYLPGHFSVRKALHKALFVSLPITGGIYFHLVAQPYASLSLFGIGFLILMFACLLTTVVLLWALSPEKWSMTANRI